MITVKDYQHRPTAFRAPKLRGGAGGNERLEKSGERICHSMEYIETKMAWRRYMRELRCKKNLTQIRVAAMLKTSQSRVAKMEMVLWVCPFVA